MCAAAYPLQLKPPQNRIWMASSPVIVLGSDIKWWRDKDDGNLTGRAKNRHVSLEEMKSPVDMKWFSHQHQRRSLTVKRQRTPSIGAHCSYQQSEKLKPVQNPLIHTATELNPDINGKWIIIKWKQSREVH